MFGDFAGTNLPAQSGYQRPAGNAGYAAQSADFALRFAPVLKLSCYSIAARTWSRGSVANVVA
jgi:hypothetical protein